MVSLLVERIATLYNPFTGHPWGIEVKLEDVTRAIDDGRLSGTSKGCDHAGRIAYLVQYVATDPIEIDVGVPEFGCCPVVWPIMDGNHRLAAAIYAGRSHIDASVSGSMRYAKQLFGADCTEDEIALQRPRARYEIMKP